MRRAPSGACGRACGASRSAASGSVVRLWLGGFIADFACFEARMVIEVDGATHSTDREVALDAARSAALAAQGYDILRFTNDDVFHNLDGVLETIHMRLIALRPRTDESTI
jgi:very-short-patch-repair endonuclease